MGKIKIGHGCFGWCSTERRSGRYGSVHLSGSPYSGVPCTKVDFDMETLVNMERKRVRMTCKVLETRDSGHAGDDFLDIRPSRPEVGEEIDLGVGLLEIKPGYDGEPDIMLKPGDGRNKNWFDPRKFYRLHDQTVDLFIEETEDDFTPAVELACKPNGAIDNGDGTCQVRYEGQEVQGMRIRPYVEPMGGGMFSVSYPSAPGKGKHLNAELVSTPLDDE